MRDIGSLKESNSEPEFFRYNLVERSDLVSRSNKSWRRESNSRKSISSNSTTYTYNLSNLNHSNDDRLSKLPGIKRIKEIKYKDSENSKILDSIYMIISDLYEEEIVPNIHEIRRKLNKNEGFPVNGQKLLKLCSGDERFKIIRLESSNHKSNDLQNEWAILLKNRPFDHFNKEVDNELLRLVSDYLVFISSYKYHKLTEDLKNLSIDKCYDSSNINNTTDRNYTNNTSSKDSKENKNNSSEDSNSTNEDNTDNNSNDTNDSTLFNEHNVNMIPVESIFNIGGRYLFAEHLKKNGPFELRNLPLGTIMNIVQKLNEIGLLVYKSNFLVPVANSKSSANKLILNLTKSFNKGYLDDIKKKFISLFDSGIKIPLSSLPIVYKRTFGEELNYLEIGYERLSDFIKKEIPSCKITSQSNQFILSIQPNSNNSEEKNQQIQLNQGNQSNQPSNSEILNSNGFENEHISQFNLDVSDTTVLYPLKITKI